MILPQQAGKEMKDMEMKGKGNHKGFETMVHQQARKENQKDSTAQQITFLSHATSKLFATLCHPNSISPRLITND